MKTTPPLRIAAGLLSLGLTCNTAPRSSPPPPSKLGGVDSRFFMEQALMLPVSSAAGAGDESHIRLTRDAAAARGALDPVREVPPTVPSDVRRVVYVAGGSEVLKPAFIARLTQTFSQSRVIISLDPAYKVVQPSGAKPLRLIWKPQNDPFAPVAMGAVRPTPAGEFGLVLENVQTVFWQEPSHRRHPFEMVYVRSFYEAVRDLLPLPDGPTAIVVRSPGTSGQLARSVELYCRVLKILRPGDFLYVDDSYLPLRLFPVERLGLEEVPVAALPRLVPQPDSVITLGVTLYRKMAGVSEEVIQEAYQRDSALYAGLDWFTPDWNPGPFRKTWEGPLWELTGAERAALLGRLDLLLKNSSLPEWARQERREAFRDIFTRHTPLAVLRPSVAKPLMALLVKVRQLARHGAAHVSPAELQSVLPRLSQLRYSLEEMQTPLLSLEELPAKGGDIYHWVRTQRKLLHNYARRYRALKRTLLHHLESAEGQRQGPLPDRSA